MLDSRAHMGPRALPGEFAVLQPSAQPPPPADAQHSVRDAWRRATDRARVTPGAEVLPVRALSIDNQRGFVITGVPSTAYNAPIGGGAGGAAAAAAVSSPSSAAAGGSMSGVPLASIRHLLVGSTLAIARGFAPVYSSHPLSKLLNVTLTARVYQRKLLRIARRIGDEEVPLSSYQPLTLQWSLPYLPQLDYVSIHRRKALQPPGGSSSPLASAEVEMLLKDYVKREALSESLNDDYMPVRNMPTPTPGFAGERILRDLDVGSYVLCYHLGGQSHQLRVHPWVAFEFSVV